MQPWANQSMQPGPAGMAPKAMSAGASPAMNLAPKAGMPMGGMNMNGMMMSMSMPTGSPGLMGTSGMPTMTGLPTGMPGATGLGMQGMASMPGMSGMQGMPGMASGGQTAMSARPATPATATAAAVPTKSCPRECGAKLAESELKAHLDSACPRRILLCPLGCGQEGESRMLSLHMEKYCPKRGSGKPPASLATATQTAKAAPGQAPVGMTPKGAPPSQPTGLAGAGGSPSPAENQAKAPAEASTSSDGLAEKTGSLAPNDILLKIRQGVAAQSKEQVKAALQMAKDANVRLQDNVQKMLSQWLQEGPGTTPGLPGDASPSAGTGDAPSSPKVAGEESAANLGAPNGNATKEGASPSVDAAGTGSKTTLPKSAPPMMGSMPVPSAPMMGMPMSLPMAMGGLPRPGMPTMSLPPVMAPPVPGLMPADLVRITAQMQQGPGTDSASAAAALAAAGILGGGAPTVPASGADANSSNNNNNSNNNSNKDSSKDSNSNNNSNNTNEGQSKGESGTTGASAAATPPSSEASPDLPGRTSAAAAGPVATAAPVIKAAPAVIKSAPPAPAASAMDDLFSSFLNEVESVAESAATAKDPAKVAAKLSSKEWQVRQEGCQELADLGVAAATHVAALVTCLSDRDAAVRTAAKKAIETVKAAIEAEEQAAEEAKKQAKKQRKKARAKQKNMPGLADSDSEDERTAKRFREGTSFAQSQSAPPPPPPTEDEDGEKAGPAAKEAWEYLKTDSWGSGQFLSFDNF